MDMTIENQVVEGPDPSGGSYGQILESSAVIGGSSVLNILFGIVRTKAMAFFLGPAGFGLFGLYASIISVAECIAGFGIGSSAVRQLAYSAASGDSARISRTARVLFRVCILLAFAGAGLLAILARPVSIFTFGDVRHMGAIALLSLAVFLELISTGQRALLQGMRKVHDLAMTAIMSAFLGLLITIPLVFVLRDKGVVPAIIGAGLVSFLVAAYFSRRVRLPGAQLTWPQQFEEASSLLKLGFAFMTSYLMTTGAGYVVRIMVLRKIGYEATGLYQAAWTLGGVYVGFILQAMGTDFYPRLTAVADNNDQCNRLVNEQTEVGLLLAGPGILATLALAPLVLLLFYSRGFLAAVGVLRWICLGSLLQVVTWPMGYVLIAKGRQALFFGTEMTWAIASLVLTWYGIRWFGLIGVGMAFAASYVVYGILLILIVGSLSGFHWSGANTRIGLLYALLIGLVFAAFSFIPSMQAICVGVVAALLSLIYSIRKIVKLVPSVRIPRSLRRMLAKANLIPGGSERAG
jgi:enterobacterial common antigen flippase